MWEIEKNKYELTLKLEQIIAKIKSINSNCFFVHLNNVAAYYNIV